MSCRFDTEERRKSKKACVNQVRSQDCATKNSCMTRSFFGMGPILHIQSALHF